MSDILNEDPDRLLNEWLGELENLIVGLEIPSTTSLITPNTTTQIPARLRPRSQASSERTNSYRFSMANLEETHESELDAILGELSLLEQRSSDLRHGRSHSRSNSTVSGATNSTISSSSESGTGSDGVLREPRTESPDNDSAFSDTVSLLSSESSASSGVSAALLKNHQNSNNNNNNNNGGNLPQQMDSAKAAKIQLALQKLEHASIRRLFVKAFSSDGASKSLLVDERMTCGHVTRLLADKNHVQMEPHWALVEHLTDFQMERLFEDHELLVDNLMMWSPDSKNRVLFLQRSDKVNLFIRPERFLPGTQMAPGSEHDEHTRGMLLDEFFTTGGQISMDGPLYMKNDAKKGWKRYQFVLRASGLYYFAKEKSRSPRDLICLTLFAGHEIYRGLGWKKKHKAPTDHTFALRSPKDPFTAKSCRYLKMLCAEDAETLEKWVTAIRIAKYGKQIYDNHKALIEDLTREELDKFSSARSSSIGSIISSVPSQCSGMNVVPPSSSSSNGRLSRASSSSSSGCLSDDNNGFDSEFTTGTIKRKPSMKPNLPLTSMTRQLKEVGETTVVDSSNPTSPERSGTLTRRHSRRRSEESNNSGTLKRRQPANRGSIESMNSSNASTPTPTPGTPVGTPLMISTQQQQQPSAIVSPLEQMPSSMTDSTFSLPPPPEDYEPTLSGSTFSLDSLPPPPPPSELIAVAASELSGSQLSLVSLPPPPPPEVTAAYLPTTTASTPVRQPSIASEPLNEAPPKKIICSQTLPPQEVKKEPVAPTSKTMKPQSVLKAPPYKSPPAYNGTTPSKPAAITPTPAKTVSFADSPVLLRRKVSFEDQVQQQMSPRRAPSIPSRDLSAPAPPPRAEATRLSTIITSPKRLTDSASNPPRDFLKDLQRVMRKKWQVAQKCKLEPATTPHEVLGFRDFTDEFGNSHSSHYYRETANVSNWVQEHYGNTTGEYALYENVGNDDLMVNNDFISAQPIKQPPAQIAPPQPVLATIKKRPPPPPPKRSESTQLTHRV
ncbi:ras-associated and pleckstrin homology domains-containing protein 1 isoform X2 [Hermetia illucens]|uniref:ras-associated and pleckstrin homology domains-containing protein 1 isoform X2 n=1 Tax=Hermetia illucens TaxID=343691 RepID=UPI0018CC70B7|nr:ras-associated and pleckstrin homology domains-containing protein 1 isoform X2 [Hermetia illucens]